MTFSNPIVAGQNLVIPGIQSPNYQAGVSGWRIARDGSVEFNLGTFRGSIEAGSLSGQHFWVNNPNTGDVIDVYNSSNKNVFSIDATGRLVATSSISTANVVINGANLFFEDTAQSPKLPPFLSGSLGPDLIALNLVGGQPQNAAAGVNGASITLFTGDTSASEWIEAEQRGSQGALLQLASSTNANQLVTLGTYTVTTDAGGTGIFNHNCGYTPKFGFLVGVNGIGANFPYQYAWFANPFTSTTAKAAFKDNLGAALASTTLGVFGLFFG